MPKIIPFIQVESIVNLSHEQISWLDTLVNQARRELQTTIESLRSKGVHPSHFTTIKNNLDIAAHLIDSQEYELESFVKKYLDNGMEG